MKYQIDESIFKYEHPLIRQLENGEITAEEFTKMQSQPDVNPRIPVVVFTDKKTKTIKLRILTAKELNQRKSGFIERKLKHINEYGKLDGSYIFDEKDTILSVYPELQSDYDEVEIDPEKCTSCQKNSAAKKIIERLFLVASMLEPRRDASPLKGKLPEEAIKLLSGEKVNATEDDIEIPEPITRPPLPLREEESEESEEIERETHILEFPRPEEPKKRKLILHNGQAAGDTLMLTAAVKALVKHHGDKFEVDVRTSNMAIWENNPYLTKLDDKDPDVDHVNCEYGGNYPGSIHKTDTGGYHFIHAFAQDLEEFLDVKIPIEEFRGDIHISDQEKGWMSQLEEMGIKNKFWIIINGGKDDFTAKWPNPEHMQKVVDYFKGKITFVQCGADGDGHVHHKLDGAIDLIGKTDLRQFIRLVYHSSGVISPVTFAMHAAAAIECKHTPPNSRPCVVIAGGREPTQWEAYPNHQFLHTCGALKGCHDNSTGGCWKSRCQPMGDGDSKDNDLCLYPVKVNDDLQIPKCIDMIKPETIIRAIEYHYEGGMLEYDE
jgi:ADP-heptose:LPS heptosyltransferase